MIGSLIKKYLFLILAFIAFLCSGISYISDKLSKNESSEIRYGKSVQTRVNKSLLQAADELAEVTSLFQKSSSLSFSEIESKTEYPYFIYRDGKLVYWSDHRFVPEYSWITNIHDSGLLAQENHVALVKKETFFYNEDKLELISLIPIYIKYQRENEYLSSGFDKKMFPVSPVKIDNKSNSKEFLNILDESGRFLFSIKPPKVDELHIPYISTYTLICIALALLFIGLFLVSRTKWICKKLGFEKTLLLFAVFMIAIRWFMLANSLPFSLYEADLFNPKFFVINAITPSLGDLLLNTGCLAIIISFVAYRFHKSRLYYAAIKADSITKSIISVAAVLLSTFVTLFCHQSLKAIYVRSNYLLDLSVSTSFSSLKLGALAFFIILAICFFLLQHVLAAIFIRLNRNSRTGLFQWLYGALLSLFLLVFIEGISWVVVIGAVYFFLLYKFKLPLYLYSLKYPTSIYFFFGAFVFTSITMKVLHEENKAKDIFDKQIYGEQFLAENDALGEGLLTKTMLAIREDSLISKAISRETFASETIENIIKENHLELYFDKYDTEVYSFNAFGEQLGFEDDLKDLKAYENDYKKAPYRTGNPNIFFINETGDKFIKQYIVFIPLKEKKGTLLIDMQLKNADKKSVYPELLMEKRFTQNPDTKLYSYAIYDENNSLVYSGGKFNYLKNSTLSLLKIPELYTEGVEAFGYDHIGVSNASGRKIVVSSEDNTWKSLFADFSFLYLSLVIIVFLIILSYAFDFGYKKLKMNFSTKIQIYLNAAFLLPFILLLFVTIGIIRSTLLDIQESFYFENTQNISSTLRIHLKNYSDGKYSKAFFEQEVNKLAQDTRTDINFFDLNGDLVYTTRPLIYEYDLLSEKINSKAYRSIIEERENEILLAESLGDLNYRAVYMAVKGGPNTQQGVIGVPFFNSSTALESQLKEVFTTILSICIALFLALLILSYFASNQLTNPLKMVAQKIKKISLDQHNEPIHWEADDEIGVLTSSYNDMLKKLEDSKDALSQSQKQTAWREMAKQVAHEIKNPLTPMKLSIQQLQRTLPSLEEKSRARIERSLNSLTEQIDNISEIANSFSEFAKMPVPRSEVFDLVNVVQKTVYLYAQNKGLDIQMEAPKEVILVRSDHQLINRVVTNLIINGIQSVPDTIKPKIQVKVYRNDREKFAIIEVKDNGSGIAEEYRNKVFMPNFSTKIDGSGLGLAMAKRGVEHSGGNIWFETEIDSGSTFYVDLPLAVR